MQYLNFFETVNRHYKEGITTREELLAVFNKIANRVSDYEKKKMVKSLVESHDE